MLSWTIVKRKKILKLIRRRNSNYLEHKEEARMLITSRLEFFNQDDFFQYNRVAIRDQKRCWGSCSSKGNLNFSYKLLFLPACLRDYIVVHELCHLKVLNHSASFWNQVGEFMPDYLERAKTLRTIEKSIGTSLLSLQTVSKTHSCSYCEQEKAF